MALSAERRISLGIGLVLLLMGANGLISGRGNALVSAGYVAVGLFIFVRGLRPPAASVTRRVPFDEQIAVLNDCGIAIDGEVAGQLLERAAKETFEDDPYRSILMVRSEIAEESVAGFTALSFFYLDTECIETDGDYASLAQRMTSISDGTLVATALADSFDTRRGVATLSGTVNASQISWQFPLRDDYVPDKFFESCQELLKSTGTRKCYAGLLLGGQDLLVFCMGPEQMRTLQERAGLRLEVL
jgi:hypothetical protein